MSSESLNVVNLQSSAEKKKYEGSWMRMKMLPRWKLYTSAMFLQAVSKGENPGDKINHQKIKNTYICPSIFSNTSEQLC